MLLSPLSLCALLNGFKVSESTDGTFEHELEILGFKKKERHFFYLISNFTVFIAFLNLYNFIDW